MDVRDLIGQHRHRAREDRDGVELAVAEVNQMAAGRFLAETSEQVDQLRLGDFLECLADAAGEGQAAQAQFFGGRKHAVSMPRWLCEGNPHASTMRYEP